MLKIVIFDVGYGGEVFADRLEEELGIVDVIRVIDWRNAAAALSGSHQIRQVAEAALRPYIGRVDLIFLANHLLSTTSLRYFRRHYKNQAFLGFEIPVFKTTRKTLVLTTKALSKTFSFQYATSCFKNKETLLLDHWTSKIDDGELTLADIKQALQSPAEILVLANSNFSDLKTMFKTAVHQNIKILDSHDSAIRDICKTLKLRGGIGRRKKS
ncbi:MAG: hypothetical protein Q4B34_00285 [Candidatus Saccharibacteria bacterium]|nr:hypothetical protein [Candidatus Saccharibacteria bacterium]